MAGANKDTAKDYHAVQVQGSPQLKEAVDGGEVAIAMRPRLPGTNLPSNRLRRWSGSAARELARG